MDNPKPAQRHPRGRRRGFFFLSERNPNRGWIIEEVILAAIRMTPVIA